MTRITRDAALLFGVPVVSVVVIGLALARTLDTSPLPMPAVPLPPCRCISHVERRDSTYWECVCIRGVTPPEVCR